MDRNEWAGIRRFLCIHEEIMEIIPHCKREGEVRSVQQSHPQPESPLLIIFHSIREPDISMLSHVRPLALLLLLPLLYRLPRNSEPFDPCRHSTVAARLQDYFADLFFGCAVVQSAFDVGREFGRAVLVAEHGDVEE